MMRRTGKMGIIKLNFKQTCKEFAIKKEEMKQGCIGDWMNDCNETIYNCKRFDRQVLHTFSYLQSC